MTESELVSIGVDTIQLLNYSLLLYATVVLNSNPQSPAALLL